MPELAEPNQTIKSRHVSDDISAPWTPINLPFASLEPCGLASRFEYNKPYIREYFFFTLRGGRAKKDMACAGEILLESK